MGAKVVKISDWRDLKRREGLREKWLKALAGAIKRFSRGVVRV